MTLTGLQSNELCEISAVIKQAYEEDGIRAREKLLERAAKHLQMTYKDSFYTKMIGEANEVIRRQTIVFKETKGKEEMVDRSMSDMICYYIGQNNDKYDEEARTLKRQLQI